MIIGLSGKYCAGKNAAASILEQRGIPTIDVDKLGHQALSAQVERIAEAFGEMVITEDEKGLRTVNRKALGEIVFSDAAQLERLESISHPWMKEETSSLIKSLLHKGARHVVINAAILYKMNLDKLCDCVIWIDAPLLIRFRRALKRDSTGITVVLKRIYTQRQLKPKPSGNFVDIYRVGNGAGIQQLERRIDLILNNIEQKGRDGR